MNKLQVGDLVELKTKTVRFYVKNLGYFYLKPKSNEFVTGYASEVSMFLGSYLKKAENPFGKVRGYGANIDDTDEKYVLVRLRNKFGESEVIGLKEADVTKIKKK